MKDDYAFPRVTKLGEQAPGMELRDWFAGMALQGLLACQDHEHWSDDDYADMAYVYANHMMVTRSEQA